MKTLRCLGGVLGERTTCGTLDGRSWVCDNDVAEVGPWDWSLKDRKAK